TRFSRDWSSDVCSSDLEPEYGRAGGDTTCGNTYRYSREGWQYCKSIRSQAVHLSPLFLYSYTPFQRANLCILRCRRRANRSPRRSEEHTSELQSRENLV